MLADGVVDAFQSIEHLLAGVDAEEIPGVALHHHQRVEPPHAHNLAASLAFQGVALLVDERGAAPQGRIMFGDESVGGAAIGIDDKLQTLGVVETDMLTEQLPDFLLVARTQNLPEERIIVGIGLAGIADVTADEQHNSQHDGQRHGHITAEEHRHRDEHAEEKGHSGRDKPSANDGDDTRDAEYGTLTAPGAVGERGSHGHHEGDVGGGEGQLVGGAESHQESGEHEVD